MHPFWDDVIRPLLDAAKPRTVVEIGAERGHTTGRLLAWATGGDATVHAIDPRPQFDVARAELEHGDRLRMHVAPSLEALPAIDRIDVALIDGDHNWYTVSAELRLLDQGARRADAPFPLVLAHDAGWPYGRRDMYYDPHSIPVEHRHDAARAGIAPGRSELGSPGINAGLWNATREGGPRNGVRTAIEDFAEGYPEPCELVVIEGWHGLAVLATETRLRAVPALRPEVERLGSAEFLRGWLERIERARIGAVSRAGQAQAAEAEALRRVARLENTLHDEPDDDGSDQDTLNAGA